MTDLVFAETQGTAGAPLVFTFHGTGGSERQFHDFAQSLIPGAHVISPRGTVNEHGALRYFKRTGEGVYDMDDLRERTQDVHFEDWRFAQGPFGGDADQLVGDLADTLFQLGLLGLPRAAAQLGEQPLFMAIAAEEFDVHHWQEQTVTASVLQRKAFMRRTGRSNGL